MREVREGISEGGAVNGRKAKALRRKIYGQMSLQDERRYARYRNGMMKNLGLRAEYQAAKKEASR